jgi:ABC-type tungstate transport system substrate-binding protein
MANPPARSFVVNLLPTTILSRVAALRAVPRAALVAVCLFFFVGFSDGAMMPFFALWARTEAAIPTQYIGLLLACY